MKVSVLASGSRGNATVFESGGRRLLVDTGIGPRVLKSRMAECGLLNALDAIVVTHAHSDHIGHCEKLAKTYRAPVFLSEATSRHSTFSEEVTVEVFGAREPFEAGGFVVSPLPLPHDAAQVALVVGDGCTSAAIATDLGEVPPGLVEHVAKCEVLLIESNHDVDLLRAGPYPDYLKRRILSAKGHLSNEQCLEFINALPRAKQRTVVLMHLSETNNTSEHAEALAKEATKHRYSSLLVARQSTPVVINTRMTQLGLPLFTTP